jgi:hypothetical protein
LAALDNELESLDCLSDVSYANYNDWDFNGDSIHIEFDANVDGDDSNCENDICDLLNNNENGFSGDCTAQISNKKRDDSTIVIVYDNLSNGSVLAAGFLTVFALFAQLF